MAVSFPTSPSTGDTFDVGRVKYEWSGSAWKQVASQPVSTGAEMPFTKSDGTTSDPIKLASSVIGDALVNDTTPQLGGSLDVNGNAIVSTSNANIAITPNGSGSVALSKVDIGGGAIDGTIIGATTTAAISGTTGTFSGVVTGATLAGTISTAAQNSITSASSLATVGTVTSGTWSGVIDGSATITMGSDATGDMYYRAASTGYLTRLAAGADGTVLTGTGTGSIPAWESVSAGVSLSGTTDGTIATVTGANALIGETALTFDGTTLNVVGNAGVGLARTDGTLHVQTASASGGSGITPVADCDDLVIENNGVAGITIGTTDATLGKISFISPSQNNGAFIEGGHNSADPVLKFSTSNTERMRITSGGNIEVNGAAHRINAAGTYFVNDTANAKMTQGITIQQGANDNEILAFKSSDVAHGMTLNPVETDTFAHFRKAHADYGGLQLASHGEAQTSANLRLEGACGADTSDTTSSYAAVQLYGFVNNPVGVRDGMTATSNAVGFNNAGTTRVIIKGDGTVHASDTSWATALDDMPDALAGRAYTTEMADRQGEGLFGGMKVNAPELVQRMEDAGIVTHAELEGEGSIPGHRFLNVQKGIKFSWDMGFQNFSFLAEIAKVLSPEQREALPAQMQQAFAQLEENKMELN